MLCRFKYGYSMKKYLCLHLLLLQCYFLCASGNFIQLREPSLFSASGFYNQSITSTDEYGLQLTAVFATPCLLWYDSLRYQGPEVNATVLASYDTLHPKDWIAFQYACKMHYFQHGTSNGATSVTLRYGISLQTPFNHFWTQMAGSLGVQAIGSWSTYYGQTLWGIAPHLHLGIIQSLADRAYVSLFLSTDTLTLEESQLSYFYGASLLFKVTPSCMVKLQPLVRLSDLYSESFFITMHDFSVSIIWVDSTGKDLLQKVLGKMS